MPNKPKRPIGNSRWPLPKPPGERTEAAAVTAKLATLRQVQDTVKVHTADGTIQAKRVYGTAGLTIEVASLATADQARMAWRDAMWAAGAPNA